jgi:hypothetical protein
MSGWLKPAVKWENVRMVKTSCKMGKYVRMVKTKCKMGKYVRVVNRETG